MIVPLSARAQPSPSGVSVESTAAETGAPPTATSVWAVAPSSVRVHASVNVRVMPFLVKGRAIAGISSGLTVPT